MYGDAGWVFSAFLAPNYKLDDIILMGPPPTLLAAKAPRLYLIGALNQFGALISKPQDL